MNRGSSYELILTLAIMDLKVRYKSNKLGFLWSFLRPLLQFFVFYLAFGIILRINGAPQFPQRLFLGVLIWNFFAEATTQGLMSYVSKKSIVSKVKVNMLIPPISTFFASAMNFGMNYIIFLILYHITMPSYFGVYTIQGVLTLAAAFLILITFIISLSVLLSTLNALFRDMQTIWELICMYGVFLTPVIYTISIPRQFMPIYYFANPLAFALNNIQSVFFDPSMFVMDRPEYLFPVLGALVIWAGLALLANWRLRERVVDYL